MSQIRFFALVLSVMACATVSATRASATVRHVCETGALTSHCDRPGGGGGDLPDPLAYSNQKFELADSEYYVLQGRVTYGPALGDRHSQAYLEINLEDYPWLANAARLQNPAYPLEGSDTAWRPLAGKTVRMSFQAHGQVIGHDYVISLIPVAP